MTRHLRMGIGIAAVLAVSLWLYTSARSSADDAAAREGSQRVHVMNFPDVQKIAGDVRIKDPLRFATLQAVRDVVVPPVAPKDTARLISGGTITVDGYTNVVLSLTGQTKGEVFRAGAVGALLLPDDETTNRAFDEKGQALFPLEVSASPITGSAAYFASPQPRFPLSFPRYKVWFYNTSDKTVTVSLFAYVTN